METGQRRYRSSGRSAHDLMAGRQIQIIGVETGNLVSGQCMNGDQGDDQTLCAVAGRFR
jgi:hypothetical protein